MKKRYYVMSAALTLLLGIYIGCSNQELGEGLDKDGIANKAKTFITQANEHNYSWCYHQFHSSMKSHMTLDDLSYRLSSIMDGLGDFIKIKSLNVYPTKSLGKNFGKVLVRCQYQNDTATFTVSIDKNLQIVGLYIK